MGSKDIGIRKSEFVVKTQLLWKIRKKFTVCRKLQTKINNLNNQEHGFIDLT